MVLGKEGFLGSGGAGGAKTAFFCFCVFHMGFFFWLFRVLMFSFLVWGTYLGRRAYNKPREIYMFFFGFGFKKGVLCVCVIVYV